MVRSLFSSSSSLLNRFLPLLVLFVFSSSTDALDIYPRHKLANHQFQDYRLHILRGDWTPIFAVSAHPTFHRCRQVIRANPTPLWKSLPAIAIRSSLAKFSNEMIFNGQVYSYMLQGRGGGVLKQHSELNE